MLLEDYFDFLSEDDIRVKGTRIGIETILYDYIHGSQSPEAIAARYRSLDLEKVFATLTWYFHNKQAVDQYLARWLEQSRKMREEQQRNPPDAVRRLRALKHNQETQQFSVASESVS